MPPITNVFNMLYDKAVDPTPVTFDRVSIAITTGEPLPVKSPDNPRRAAASKPLMQGILALCTGAVQEIGYEKGAKDIFLVKWENPFKKKDGVASSEYARANFATNELEVSSEDSALIAFGIIGFGAAFHYGVSSFKDAWLALLSDVTAIKRAALTVEAIGQLSDITYGALRYGAAWPSEKDAKAKSKEWTVKVKTAKELSALPLTSNLRNLLAVPDDFETIMQVNEATDSTVKRSRFLGEQLSMVQRFIERRKHLALLGPAGVGKSLCAFESFRLLGMEVKGVDYQLFTCHEEVKTSDLIGAWQPDGKGGFVWADGPLVRAMTANGGKGQPFLVEEFTRMPTKSQNVFISALSDGYLVKNEKPGIDGTGEIVIAGEDFVVLADMNVDPSVDDIDLYGAAFASRVRKIEFPYPKQDQLVRIVRSETGVASTAATAVGKVYDHVMKLYSAHDVAHPMSPRAAVFWMEDYQALVEDGMEERSAAQTAAKHTWLRDVCGTDEKLRGSLLNEIEGAFRMLTMGQAKAKQAAK